MVMGSGTWAQLGSAETSGLSCLPGKGRQLASHLWPRGENLVQLTLPCSASTPAKGCVAQNRAHLVLAPSLFVAVLTTTSYYQWIPECRGELSHLHHLLPPLPGHAPGQAAEPWGGHPDPAVDLHQVLPGSHLHPKQVARRRGSSAPQRWGCTKGSTQLLLSLPA